MGTVDSEYAIIQIVLIVAVIKSRRNKKDADGFCY